jgi:hypothetical protein
MKVINFWMSNDDEDDDNDISRKYRLQLGLDGWE